MNENSRSVTKLTRTRLVGALKNNLDLHSAIASLSFKLLSTLASFSETNDRQALQDIEQQQKIISQQTKDDTALHRLLLNLLQAEIYRVKGRHTDAMDHYEVTVEQAEKSNRKITAALTCELVALFYYDWNKQKLALPYLLQAKLGYQRVGAYKEAYDLGSRHKLLADPVLKQALEDETNFQQLVEDAVDVIWSTDLTGNFTYLSPQFKELFSFNTADCLGSCCIDYVHPDDHLAISESVQNLLNGKPSENKEFRHRCADGSFIWVLVRANIFHDNHAQPIGMQGIIRDISKLKEAQLALHEVQNRFRLITENVPGMIYRYTIRADGSQAVLYAGPQCYDLFEVEAEAVLKDNWLLFRNYDPEDFERVKEKRMESAKNLSQFRVEYRVNLPSQGLRWRRSISQPSQTAEGDIVWDGVITDITSEKNTELQLQNANAQMAKTAKLKDNFLATMSHELRTPLTAVLGINEGLRNELFGPLTEEQKSSLEIVQESGNHLLELINEVLDLTKIESGFMEIYPTTINTRKLCESCLKLVSQQAEKKHITLHMQLPYYLPSLKADNTRMRQILMNLLNNAIKFTHNEGEVTLSVNHLKSGECNSLEFSVIDTGIGISESEKQNLFDPFHQVQSSLDRSYEGIGLGLALVQRFAELHHGSVTVESQKDLGSSFKVSIPCEPPSRAIHSFVSPQNDDVVEKPEAPFDLTGDSKLTVVLAEDNDSVANVTTRYLEFNNIAVHRVNDGDAAVNAVKRHHPDVVLMDIQMPGSDGLQAISQLRSIQTYKDLPIIALTGLAMKDDRARCLSAGANDYLCKPYRMKELYDLIKKHLSERTPTSVFQ